MKLPLITLALALSLCSTEGHALLLSKASIKKALGKTSVANIYSGIDFHYLDKEDRIDIVTSFLKRVQVEYVLLPLKEKRLGLSLSKMREEALQIENSFEDAQLLSNEQKNPDAREKVSFIQAKENQDFFDRMLKLVAQFKDTHFGLHTKISRPAIYIGTTFYRADGKILVGSIENKIMGLSSKLSGTDFSSIKAGDEVLSVDGIAIEEKIKELKPFINSSSDAYADMVAIWSLTNRNFRYPDKNFITIKFKNAGTFKLPYYANLSKDVAPRLDANIYFTKLHIPSDITIGMVYNENTKTWDDNFQSYSGYGPRNLYQNLIDLKEYKDEKKNPAIRTGYYIKKGVVHGVLQLLTFMPTNVTIGETTLPFTTALANFIKELKTNDVDLIMDLRNNGGGQIGYTAKLLSLIANTGANYPGQTGGYRIVPSIRELSSQELYQPLVGEELELGISLGQMKDILQNTIAERRDYTPMFSYSSVTPDPSIGGYDKKIVALISPNCISACDITSFILKASKRATLIGTQSNGTGAGFSSNYQIKTTWEDDSKIFNTSIPNLLFGLPGSDSDTDTLVFEKDSVDRLDTENRPTIADVQYSNTSRDILNKNIGWLDKAVEVLESK